MFLFVSYPKSNLFIYIDYNVFLFSALSLVRNVPNPKILHSQFGIIHYRITYHGICPILHIAVEFGV